MFGQIGMQEILLILFILLLLFGAKRLPEMGKSLGHGMREFKDAVTGTKVDADERPQVPQQTAAPAPPPAPPAAAPAQPPAQQPADSEHVSS